MVVNRKWINDWIFASETSSIPLLPRQFFQLEIYNSDGSRLTESQIHSQLMRIRSQSWKTDKEPVGILTSEHRHTWGQAYNRLLTGRSQGNWLWHWVILMELWQDMLRFETLLCEFIPPMCRDSCEYWCLLFYFKCKIICNCVCACVFQIN